MIRFIMIALILTSCSASNKLKRAERLIKDAEAKGAVWHVDTVYKEIPIYIDSVRLDSVFVAKQGDTVYLEKDRLKIKYVRLAGDSVFIEGKCEADTVYKTIPITVTKEIKAKGLDWKWLFVSLVIGAILMLVIRR